jgi:hypothetical protein
MTEPQAPEPSGGQAADGDPVADDTVRGASVSNDDPQEVLIDTVTAEHEDDPAAGS